LDAVETTVSAGDVVLIGILSGVDSTGFAAARFGVAV